MPPLPLSGQPGLSCLLVAWSYFSAWGLGTTLQTGTAFLSAFPDQLGLQISAASRQPGDTAVG